MTRFLILGLAIAAGATFSLAVLAAVVLDRPRPTFPASQATPLSRPVLGMSINVYHAPDMAPYREAIDGIADLGCNTLQIVTPMFVENGASRRVEILVGPDRGPSRADLLDLIRHARARGLRVHLMPQVNLYAPRGNEWRGKISPDDWPGWWASYHDAMIGWADLAAASGVDLFVVGCELLSTQGPEHEHRWRSLIADCRARFRGELTYSTNWDRFDRVLFWDALDAIGISGYWDLTRGAADPTQPTAGELARRWRGIRERVLRFAEDADRPILFTEIGYPSLPWALRNPWNYLNNGAPARHDVQARGYRAFVAAWRDLLAPPAADALADPRVAGVCFYKWDIHGDGGPTDTGYGIRGKPAYEVVGEVGSSQ